MHISGNFSVSGIDSARSVSRGNAANNTPSLQPATESAITTPTDQLDLSPEALAVSSSQGSGEVFRADRVAELRAAIAQGNYDTDDKMSAALDKFLDQLG